MSTAPQNALYAGTSGWAYPTWKPGFYPAGLPSKRFLEHYASRLNSVEVNYTFRALPSAEQLAGWLSSTPRDFRFSFKAPQSITHIRRLRGCEVDLESFLDCLQAVVKAGKDGVLLFQFPPNFRATALGKDKQPNQQALTAFLKDAAKLLHRSKWKIALEFRDASWFADETYEVLRKSNAALCHAESDALATPDISTADFHYARFRASSYTESRLSLVCKRLGMLTKKGTSVRLLQA